MIICSKEVESFLSDLYLQGISRDPYNLRLGLYNACVEAIENIGKPYVRILEPTIPSWKLDNMSMIEVRGVILFGFHKNGNNIIVEEVVDKRQNCSKLTKISLTEQDIRDLVLETLNIMFENKRGMRV